MEQYLHNAHVGPGDRASWRRPGGMHVTWEVPLTVCPLQLACRPATSKLTGKSKCKPLKPDALQLQQLRIVRVVPILCDWHLRTLLLSPLPASPHIAPLHAQTAGKLRTWASLTSSLLDIEHESSQCRPPQSSPPEPACLTCTGCARRHERHNFPHAASGAPGLASNNVLAPEFVCGPKCRTHR